MSKSIVIKLGSSVALGQLVVAELTKQGVEVPCAAGLAESQKRGNRMGIRINGQSCRGFCDEQWYMDKGYTLISVDEWLSAPQPIKVLLNTEYTAEVAP